MEQTMEQTTVQLNYSLFYRSGPKQQLPITGIVLERSRICAQPSTPFTDSRGRQKNYVEGPVQYDMVRGNTNDDFSISYHRLDDIHGKLASLRLSSDYYVVGIKYPTDSSVFISGAKSRSDKNTGISAIRELEEEVGITCSERDLDTGYMGKVRGNRVETTYYHLPITSYSIRPVDHTHVSRYHIQPRDFQRALNDDDRTQKVCVLLTGTRDEVIRLFDSITHVVGSFDHDICGLVAIPYMDAMHISSINTM